MRVEEILKEYEKGCSCTIGGKPSDCEECLNSAVRAIKYWQEESRKMDRRPMTDRQMVELGFFGGPITTRHVGTIAFQGTDAQINEAMKKWLGGVK